MIILVLSLNLELTILDQLAGQRATRIFLSLFPQLQTCAGFFFFFDMAVEDPNSCYHIRMATTLLTELFPQPTHEDFSWHFPTML